MNAKFLYKTKNSLNFNQMICLILNMKKFIKEGKVLFKVKNLNLIKLIINKAYFQKLIN